MRLLIPALLATALPGAANAAAFVNGSFEAGAPIADPSGADLLEANAASATAITGWTVTSGSVDYIDNRFWTAGAGSRSIDLSGAAAGTISQTFDTTAGQLYHVDFLLAANGDGPPDPKTLGVSATGNAGGVYSIAYDGTARPAMNWTPYRYDFTATGTSTTLSFASTTFSAFGPALDAVNVAAAPEAGAWAMLIAGFGVAGGALRRRRGHGLRSAGAKTDLRSVSLYG